MVRNSKTISITFWFVLFATLLVYVEDLVTESTCKWICYAESGDITLKDLKKMISQERMIKLEFMVERVGKPCANQTLPAIEKHASFTIWLKKMSSTSSEDIEFLSQALLEEIYSGRILFYSYKQINISCIYRSSNGSTKHNSEISMRLSFNPRSVMYYVEQLANYSRKNDKFLTFIRMEKQTLVTFYTSGSSGNSSSASASHKELIVSDKWWVVTVVIFVVFILYSPITLLNFCPSNVLIKLPRKQHESEENEDLPSPVQEDHAEEHEDNVPLFQENDNNISSTQNFGMESAVFDNRNSEMVGMRTFISIPFREAKPCVVANSAAKNDLTDKSEQITPPSATEASTSRLLCDRTGAPSITVASVNTFQQPRGNRTDTEHRGKDIVLNIPDTLTNHSRPEESQEIVSRGSDENLVWMIIVGGPSPVGIGSWIGDNFFTPTNSSQWDSLKGLVKFVLITFFPLLLLTGLGDLLLVLIKFNSRIESYLPSSLTRSVFHGMFDRHLAITLTAVLFFLFFVFRYYLFFRGLSSNNVSESNSWKPCYVHSRHQFVLYRLKCVWYPCDHCKNSLPDCTMTTEIIEDIVHNLQQMPSAFIDHCTLFFQGVSFFLQQLSLFFQQVSLYFHEVVFFQLVFHEIAIGTCYKVCWKVYLICILFVITVVIAVVMALVIIVVIILVPSVFFVLLVSNFLMDLVLSSPLFCLCVPMSRTWIVKQIFKNTFRGSNYVLPILEFLSIVFSLFWPAIFYSHGAIYMEIYSISFLNLLKHNTKEMLPHVSIVILASHYCWSCYTSFTAPYCELVKKLFLSYRQKFDSLVENGGPDYLICYEQGEQKKLIPRKLFEYACKHRLIEMPIRNSVWKLTLKMGSTLLAFFFIFPVIQAPSSDSVLIVTTFLAVAYPKINDFINGATSKLSKEDVEKVVDDYINKIYN